MKLLRTQKVVYISCGEEHTAVLTKVRDSEYSSLFRGALVLGMTRVLIDHGLVGWIGPFREGS